MIEVIEEISGYAKLEYKRYRGIKSILNVRVKSFKKQYNVNDEDEGLIYFLLIDSYGNIIANAYNYMNEEISDSSYKERENTLTALKHLYSFMELFYYYDEQDINRETFKKFRAFLKGGQITSSSENLMFKNLTVRTNNTLNNYFNVYRKYFNYLKIDDSIFEEFTIVRNQKGGEGKFTHGKVNTSRRYNTTNHTVKKETVPKYISYEEYVKCITHINQSDKEYIIILRNTIIIHLMYEYGLRIGEVLGITIEDIYNSKEAKSSEGQIIIRNRYTDKSWRFAKGCMKIKKREDYKDPDYKRKGLGAGYQVVKIEESTVQLIEEYMQATVFNSFLSPTLANNLKNKNIADTVDERDEIKENKYTFISKNFTPITGTAWNRILKEIFSAVGISIDKGKKENNLNHRFRHGFAMYKIMVEKYDKIKLKNAMRHRNPNSCDAYFNPTEEDLQRMAYESKELLKNGGIEFD